MDLRGVATPGTPSRRTGHRPKYIQYEGLHPARREHAPNAAPSPRRSISSPLALPATAFRGRVTELVEREARTGSRRHVVVLAVDGLTYETAAGTWTKARTERVESVLPTTSSAGWLSSLTGAPVSAHAVPGVVFTPRPAPVRSASDLINVFDYRGPDLTTVRENVFSDARLHGYLPLAVLGDLEAYDCAWRDVLLRDAVPVTGHRFYTGSPAGFAMDGGDAYRAPSPAAVGSEVRTAIDAALARHGDSGPCLVWCYIELDRHVHHHGYDAHVRECLRGLEQVALELTARDLLVLAHSDHGLTPTRHDPGLAELLDTASRRHGFVMGGAGRIRWIYPAPGSEDRLTAELRRRLPASVRLVDSDTLLPPGSPGRARIGPISLVALAEDFVTDPAYTHDHGSALDAELYTPLSTWR